jgi:hypothetical protein
VEIETICSNRSLLPQDELHYSPNGRAQTPLGSKSILEFINCKEASISGSQSESVVSFTSIPADDSERRLLKLARCISLTSACTTSDIGGRNSGSGWHTPQCKITKEYIRRHLLIIRFQKSHSWSSGGEWWELGGERTWTQRATISANRESDLAGYIPCNFESTILARASMSCSWGVAHRTRDCSDLGLVLQCSRRYLEIRLKLQD